MILDRTIGSVDTLSRFGALFSGAALLLMMLIGAADVILSKFFNAPVPGAFEATEALMVISAFMAIGYNQYKRGHIAVTLFTSRLKGTPAGIFRLISHAMTFVFFFLLAWQGWLYGLHSLEVLEYESGLISFPVYPAKLLAALGASLAALQCVADFARKLRELLGKEGAA
jgi:TRAP-type C4-dicarboxylate transport system permease small subunit